MTAVIELAKAPTGKPPAESSAVTDEQVADAMAELAWFGKSLIVADPDKVQHRILRRNLSASTSKSVSSCAARFAIESLLPRVMNPLGPAELGTASHTVLEHFYDLAPDKRTMTALRRRVNPAVREHLAPLEGTPEYDDLFAEVKRTITPWVENIFELENPSEVNVFRTEMEFKGITLSNGVPFVGYLDRTRYEGDLSDMSTVTLHIDDYKTGKKVKYPSQRFGDDYGDQMRLYDDAIERTHGRPAGSATLIWPRQRKLVPADLSRPAKRATLAAFSRSWDYMRSTTDAATFPAIPSALCGWCPAANSCPVANITSDKAKANARTMHGGPDGPVALGIPTVHSFATPPRMDEVAAQTPTEETVTQPDTVKVMFPVNKWAVMAVASLTDTAATHLDIYGQPLKPATIHSLATVLGGIVEQVHREVFLGGFDWTFDSAARVVHSLNASLRSRPAPFGEDLQAWEKWRKTLIGLTAAKVRIAVAMVDVAEFGDANFDALLVNTTIPEQKQKQQQAEPIPA